MSIINFDHNATTKLSDESLEKMIACYKNNANTSSIHQMGRCALTLVEEVRELLQKSLNASNYEVIFTSCGSEANNLALFSDDFAQILRAKIEHSSVYNVRPKQAEIIDLSVDENGVINLIDLKVLKNSMQNFLTSLMLVNNETGAFQPVKEAAKIVHQNSGLIHTDLVCAFGKIAIDLEDLNVDFASVSAHKINGPQGCGALLVRKGIDVRPMIFGGGQEKNKRAGTLNVAAIAGFGEALKLLPKRVLAVQKCAVIRDFIESEMKKIAGENVQFFSQNVERLANTSFFAVQNCDSQTQLINFDLNNIMVSNGAACSSGVVFASRILQAMNVNEKFLGGIRISLSPENTIGEAEKFIEVWKDFYNRQIM